MPPWWPVLVFGWGPVVVAATVFFLAFRLQRSGLAFVGAIVATPFLFTISGYPHPLGRFGGPIALLANFASAWCLGRQQRSLARGLLLPFAIVAAVLAYLVMTQT